MLLTHLAKTNLNFRRLLPALVVASLPVASMANDGGLSLGGAPKLLKGHPFVEMTSELIKITVEDNKLTADCNFIFTNRGPACSVRMGFPDEGLGADNPDEEGGDNVMKTRPKTTFLSFESWINGLAVKTQLVRADKPGQYWHTKTVTFPAHSVRNVRDVYTQMIGGGLTQDAGVWGNNSRIGYIVHTGASWHGKIGRSEIIVAFNRKGMKSELKLVPWNRKKHGPTERDAKSLWAGNAVLWKGPCTPASSGTTLRFVRANWLPGRDDDIDLWFNYKKNDSNLEPTAMLSNRLR